MAKTKSDTLQGTLVLLVLGKRHLTDQGESSVHL